jgi:hypothetical protein
MHPDVEPFAKDVAEKQKAMWEAWHRLEESNERFLRANIDTLSYYAHSDEHRRVFQEWVAASRALERAVYEMHEQAMDAAGIPADHPLRKWLEGRKAPDL